MSEVYESKKASSRKGNTKKSGQAHKNTYAFHANKSSKITKRIAAMPVGGLCEKCVEVIMWRKKFKKYKPLTQMKKWYVPSLSLSFLCLKLASKL